MIAFLNNKGQTVTLEDYTYDAGTETEWYKYSKDTTEFHNYMTDLLTSNNFPLPAPSSPNPSEPNLDGESFDDAFWDFINGADQPDKWSTWDCLMMAPRYAVI